MPFYHLSFQRLRPVSGLYLAYAYSWWRVLDRVWSCFRSRMIVFSFGWIAMCATRVYFALSCLGWSAKWGLCCQAKRLQSPTNNIQNYERRAGMSCCGLEHSPTLWGDSLCPGHLENPRFESRRRVKRMVSLVQIRSRSASVLYN